MSLLWMDVLVFRSMCVINQLVMIFSRQYMLLKGNRKQLYARFSRAVRETCSVVDCSLHSLTVATSSQLDQLFVKYDYAHFGIIHICILTRKPLRGN